jgi:hypothetical protein
MDETTVANKKPPARARLKVERRRAVVVSGGMLLVVAVSAVAAIVVASGQATPPPVRSVSGMSDSELRTARVTREVVGAGCSQQTFDNQTGRMADSSQPCDPTVYDKNGVPVPIGTIHRLDAISKSFPGGR